MRRIVRTALTTVVSVAIAACGGDRGGDKAGAKMPPSPAAANLAAAPPGPDRESRPDQPVAATSERRPARSVYSFVDNRLSGHILRGGGLVVPAGSAGAGKYLRFLKDKPPLKLLRDRDGRRVGAPTRKSVTLYVPLTAAQVAGQQRVRLRTFGDRNVTTTIKVNGDKADRIELASGWVTTDIALPPGTLEPGENAIELAVRRGVVHQIEWVHVGGAAPVDDAPTAYDRNRDALVLPDGGGVAHYVMVPPDAGVAGDVGGSGCAVAVTATPTDGAPVTGTLRGDADVVDLSSLADRVVRLELRGAECPRATLANAAIVVPGAEPTVARGAKPRYVVFWVMDALRANRVRLFNPKARPEVPVFEQLAESSAVFTQAYVQGNESRASHGSMWTSLYPVVHGFLSARGGIANRWLTIDELMKQAGMYTSGMTANGYIVARRGFGKAWNQYTNLIHDGGGLKGEWILDKALGTIEKRKDRPWFLYIGTIDTHATWRAKEPWLSKYDKPLPYRGRFRKNASATDMAEINAGTLSITRRDVERIRAMYDANVSYTDQTLGSLLETLDDWGVRNQTMIVITADHGDELFERKNVVGHAKSLRETLVHVPLIVHYPPLFPAGSIPEGAEVVDIVPTIADALELPWNDQWQGESLLPLAHGVGAGYPRMSFASQFEHTHAGRIGRWKVRIKGKGGEALVDVATDPNERRDLRATAPFEYRFVADPLMLLRTHNRAWKKRDFGNAANTRAGFPAAMGE